jgi:hypothetical protein
VNQSLSVEPNEAALTLFQKDAFDQRQFDVDFFSPFGPREARPKRRKEVPRFARHFPKKYWVLSNLRS